MSYILNRSIHIKMILRTTRPKVMRITKRPMNVT